MNLDWHRLKAVVLQSDDWGLAAWSADDQAHRVLAGSASFRTPAGMAYGRSTLESADDVRALVDLLGDFRGGDGFPPVWQANTVTGAPDYEAMGAPLFEADEVPVTPSLEARGRWARPGLKAAVRDAMASGLWWPELHGLHHLPETAWLAALRRNQRDAREAHAQQSPVCNAVEASGEYDPTEPQPVRARNLRQAIALFREQFGRAPDSFCPPDYRFDDWVEGEAESLGVRILQGKGEQAGQPLLPLARRVLAWRFPHHAGGRFYMPPRIGFEPRGEAKPAGKQGLDAALRGARAAWGRGQPAMISSHRVAYAHLDAAWSEAGRAALRSLIGALVADGAVFLTDVEVRQLVEHGWALRHVGVRGALLRYYGVPLAPLELPLPDGATGARFAEGRGDGSLVVDGGRVELRVQVGEYLLEWSRP